MPNNEKTDKVQKSAAKNKQTKRSVKQSKTAKNQKNTTSKNEKALPKKSNARGVQDAERKRTAQKKNNQKKRNTFCQRYFLNRNKIIFGLCGAIIIPLLV